MAAAHAASGAARRRRRALVVLAFAAFGLFRPSVPIAEARLTAPAPVVGLRLDLVGGFLGEINLLRGTLGLGRLTVSAQLTSVATSWSQRMASEDRLFHNPDLGALVSGWSSIGENVGVGYDVLGLMRAFIGSPSHYANLVNPAWTHVGVGVASGPNGVLYTTHDFMRLDSAPAPQPDPDPHPAPAPDPDPGADADPNPAPRRRPRTTAAPAAPPTPTAPTAPVVPTAPPGPHPTEQRVAAVLEPLRSLET